MMNLTKASQQLFMRDPDERYETLQGLYEFCQAQKTRCMDHWRAPSTMIMDDQMSLCMGTDGSFLMNDWSFGQLCKMASVAKETVNRLTPATASKVFGELLPRDGKKPLQILTDDNLVRSIHGTQYTRLWNTDLLNVVREFAVDFQPPQKGLNGGTGLYAGEQDMFLFLIDPLGWVEINGENFAPGFFLWNSEVGRRSLGIQTFWFQAVCANHIVWDATEVVEWTRKHTAKVADGLGEIRRLIEGLVTKRDQRKDGFARIMQKAMVESAGSSDDEALSLITGTGASRAIAKKALELAQQKGRYTIWTLVDALTRIAGDERNAGDRTEVDQKAGSLLSLVEA